jgi:hypothetical protein
LLIVSVEFEYFAFYSFKPAKKLLFEYTITFSAGHKSADCGGVGELCLTQFYPSVWGLTACHIPCWGSGSDCQHSFKIGLAPASTAPDVYDGQLDTEDHFNGPTLNMPDRSCEIEVESQTRWMNIPSQVVAIQDYNENSPPHLYNLENITITEEPIFEHP